MLVSPCCFCATLLDVHFRIPMYKPNNIAKRIRIRLRFVRKKARQTIQARQNYVENHELAAFWSLLRISPWRLISGNTCRCLKRVNQLDEASKSSSRPKKSKNIFALAAMMVGADTEISSFCTWANHPLNGIISGVHRFSFSHHGSLLRQSKIDAKVHIFFFCFKMSPTSPHPAFQTQLFPGSTVSILHITSSVSVIVITTFFRLPAILCSWRNGR